MRSKHIISAAALALVAVAGLFAQAKPTVAVLSGDSPIYSTAAIDSKKVAGTFERGEPVLIQSSQEKRVSIDGIPTIWYQVKTGSGTSGWLPGSRLAFTATAFPRSAFASEEQYVAYVTMAARVGEKVVAVRSYEKVKKGDVGYYVSVSEGSLPFCVVWEHNLAATPGESWLPKDFPPALKPFTYFVNAGDIELLGESAATPLAALAKSLPPRFKTADGFFAEEQDDDLPWFVPEGFADTGYDDSEYGDYDYGYGDYDYEDYDSEYEYIEGEETYGKFQVGSVVILGKHDDINGGANWTDEMNKFVGKSATITELVAADSQGFLVVRVTGNSYVWRVRNLTLRGSGEAGSYGFKVGDRVIVGAHRYIDESNNWADEMMQYVGQEATITSMEGADGSGCFLVHIDIDNGDWYWRVENMEPAN